MQLADSQEGGVQDYNSESVIGQQVGIYVKRFRLGKKALEVRPVHSPFSIKFAGSFEDLPLRDISEFHWRPSSECNHCSFCDCDFSNIFPCLSWKSPSHAGVYHRFYFNS
jgi:hypothetical protein